MRLGVGTMPYEAVLNRFSSTESPCVWTCGWKGHVVRHALGHVARLAVRHCGQVVGHVVKHAIEHAVVRHVSYRNVGWAPTAHTWTCELDMSPRVRPAVRHCNSAHS